MASAISQGYHAQLMGQERERVMLRIQQGTKASSPQTLNVKRMKPLYYSNPLPDNSSGSKNRLFFENKDESGRPNAMEQVAMRQRGMHIEGGVLKNFKYAQKILGQRARDTTNLRLATEGLPEIPSPILQLSPEESMNMELNALITSLQNAIDEMTLDALTVNEVKNIPRLLVALAGTYTQEDVANLLDIVQGMQTQLETINTPPANRVMSFLSESLEPFLVGLVDTRAGQTIADTAMRNKKPDIRTSGQAIVDMEPQNKEPAIRALAKKYFGNIAFRVPRIVPRGEPPAEPRAEPPAEPPAEPAPPPLDQMGPQLISTVGRMSVARETQLRNTFRALYDDIRRTYMGAVGRYPADTATAYKNSIKTQLRKLTPDQVQSLADRHPDAFQ